MTGGIHHEDPFATPGHLKTPARRLRGRTAAPVTIWTAGPPGARAGLTVSSLLVADGEPPLLLGLLNDTTDLFEAITTTGAFVAHILPAGEQVLADIFAGLRPNPGGPFAGLDVTDGHHGPVIDRIPDRAYCRLRDEMECGFQRLVRARIEEMEFGEIEDPLLYFRGRYERLGKR